MSDDNNTQEDNTALVPLTQDELAALVPASLDALAVPTHATSAPPEKRYVSVPYIGMRGKKSEKNIEALDAAGIKVDKKTGNGVFYLMDIEPVDIRNGKDSVGIHLIQYARLYTAQDNKGNITETLLANEKGAFEDGFREHIFALVAAVLSPGQYKAATLSLRGAQVNALRQTLALIGEPGRPGPAMKPEEWAKRSAAHALTATPECKIPGFRFRTEIWSTLEEPKGPGEPFNQGNGSVAPTPVEEFKSLLAWSKDAWPSIQVASAKYMKTVEEARRKLVANA